MVTSLIQSIASYLGENPTITGIMDIYQAMFDNSNFMLRLAFLRKGRVF